MDWIVAGIGVVLGAAGLYTIYVLITYSQRTADPTPIWRPMCTIRTIYYRNPDPLIGQWQQTVHSHCQGRKNLDAVLDETTLVVTETAHDWV